MLNKIPLAAATLTLLAAAATAQNQPVIGLITKTETNPFFVKMKEGAAGRRQGQGRQAADAAPARPTATTPAR